MRIKIHLGASSDTLTVFDKKLKEKGMTFDLSTVQPYHRNRIIRASLEDAVRSRKEFPSMVHEIGRAF